MASNGPTPLCSAFPHCTRTDLCDKIWCDVCIISLLRLGNKRLQLLSWALSEIPALEEGSCHVVSTLRKSQKGPYSEVSKSIARKELSPTNHCLQGWADPPAQEDCKPRGQPDSNLMRDLKPEPPGRILPGFPPRRNYELIHMCSLKLLCFG